MDDDFHGYSLSVSRVSDFPSRYNARHSLLLVGSSNRAIHRLHLGLLDGAVDAAARPHVGLECGVADEERQRDARLLERGAGRGLVRSGRDLAPPRKMVRCSGCRGRTRASTPGRRRTGGGVPWSCLYLPPRVMETRVMETFQ